MADFNGRTVLVTGASGGIGGATVRQLVAAGADVIAGGRNGEALEAVAAETGARPLPFDLGSETASAARWRASTSTGSSTAAASVEKLRRRWTPISQCSTGSSP
jgi:NADP-dependent 3-hydroxy acid dehydrogenase YdfG